jgi:polyisoprenoid-binding protein YceI
MKSLVLLSVFAFLPAGLFLRAPAASPAPASEATAYEIDGVHSCVVFRIKHMGVSWFYGRFNQVSGALSYDEAKPEASTISIEIAADSVDTNNKDRDKHVTGPSMFSAAEFPKISFKSTKVAKKDKKLSVTGDFTFHGKTKSITVDVDPVGAADTKMGKRAGFETMFEFKRSDYGLGQDLDALGDDIRVMVSVEGIVPEKKK